MTPTHLQLVKDTVPVLRESGVALTTYFYQRMLKHHPELKNTFNMEHQHSGRQPRALAAAVLAYAEHIDHPDVLAKAIARMSTKHVSLNIQPDEYAIVGDHLLHSISEVLKVPMDSELIAAWKAAYMQLAELLIETEKAKYTALRAKHGGWAGWRIFEIMSIEAGAEANVFELKPQDAGDIVAAEAGDFISVRIEIAGQNIKQPQQFNLVKAQAKRYCIEVKADAHPSKFSVQHALLTQYKVGDCVEVSAPMRL